MHWEALASGSGFNNPKRPKNIVLFGIIGKKPVFMRLFSIFPACFLFGIIGDNIMPTQYIIISLTQQKTLFAVY